MKYKKIPLDEGKYVIQVEALKIDKDEPSAMAPYLSNNSIVTKEAEKTFLTLMLLEEHIITKFQIQIEQDDFITCVNTHKDESSQTRYEIFQLNQLQTIHQARVQYEVEHEGQTFSGDEILRLSFDADSIQDTADLDL